MSGRPCKFYRNPENLHKRHRLGVCEFIFNNTICEGDIQFCEHFNLLKEYLMKEKQTRDNLLGATRKKV